MASKPSHDTHELRAAYRAYAALAEQTAPLRSRIGMASPQELAAALMSLAPEDYQRRASLLGGVRILHRGRRFEDGRDVYPDILNSMLRAFADRVARFLAEALASAALTLRQPLPAFCDLETTDGDALVDQRKSYVSFVRVRGMNRIALRADVERIAAALRIDLSGLFEQPGHALQAWYACDPHLSGPEIDRHLASPRSVARQIGLDLADIFAERERVWPRIMRAEDCYFVLWSKKSLLTKEEDRQAERKRNARPTACRTLVTRRSRSWRPRHSRASIAPSCSVSCPASGCMAWRSMC